MRFKIILVRLTLCFFTTTWYTFFNYCQNFVTAISPPRVYILFSSFIFVIRKMCITNNLGPLANSLYFLLDVVVENSFIFD